jgi:hypothetical protein
MRPTSRFGSKTAALVAALLLVGTATAQEARPAAPAAVPQIHKMIIYNGPVPTVSYTVLGGSPHLQALVQTLQFTENELNLTGELQKLRLGIVTNEQLGLSPISMPGCAPCYPPPDSALKSALIPGLAQEATPAVAYQLINLWERVQTELQAEQARAAAALGAPPARQNAQPVAPGVPQPEAPVGGAVAVPQADAQQLPTPPVMFPAQAASQGLPTLLDPQQVFAFQQMVRQRMMQTQRLRSMRVQR